MLPRLLERAGTNTVGSITGLYTVLVEGDDMNEPIADAVRSILDGHIVLTRELAHAGHYPVVDVLQSVSRLVGEVTDPAAQRAAQELRALLAAHRDKRDLIAIGAYERGTAPLVDRAIDLQPEIDAFLRQHVEDPTAAPEAEERLARIVGTGDGAPGAADDPMAAGDAILAELVQGVAEPEPASFPPGPSAIPPLHLSV